MRQLWSEGRTSYEISERTGASRGSIMGLLSRMGLKQLSKERARHASGNSRSIQKHFMYGRGYVPSATIKRVVGLKDTRTLPDDPTPEQRVSLLDLERHHCRFPFNGDPETTYCGRDKVSGYSFCQQHRERCFIKTEVAKVL